MSKISFEDFVARFKEDLVIKTVGFEDLDLKDIPEYDSMGKITASLIIEGLYGFQIDFDVLDNEKNLRCLWDYCNCKAVELPR